jgi:hypothetical protein
MAGGVCRSFNAQSQPVHAKIAAPHKSTGTIPTVPSPMP